MPLPEGVMETSVISKHGEGESSTDKDVYLLKCNSGRATFISWPSPIKD